MSRRHSTVLFLVLAGVTVATQSAAPPGTAILAGQTIDAATGAPVANTLLGLSQRAASGPNTTPTAPNTQLVLVMADGQGRFVVRDVPKGSFLLLATAPGYIVSNYGQGRATGPTRTIDISGGEHLTDLKILLWRHGVISGTVTDEAGEPMVGVNVRVLRRANNGPGGEPRYMPGTETTTDDRGMYRLTMLTPGQFLVTVPQTQVTVPASVVDTFLQSIAGRGGEAAGGRLLDLMSSPSAVPFVGGGVRIDNMLLQSSGNGRLVTIPPPEKGVVSVYPTSFYASGESARATVMVGSGEERAGVDFHVKPVRAVRISGVVTADGSPASNVAVRLTRAGGQAVQNENGSEVAATVTAADGSFTLLGVPAGQYLLKALKAPRLTLAPALASNPAIVAAYSSPAAPAPAAGGAALIGAQVPLTIGDADVRDLVVSLKAGATATGQIVFTGSVEPTPQQLQAIGVLLSSEDGGLPGAGLQIVRASATGTFKITAPAPGKYGVAPLGMPQRWRASGILVGGRRLTGPLDLSGDDVADVSITFTDQVGQIAGTIRTSSGAASTTAEVAVFLTDRASWIQDPLNPRQPRIEQASNTGAFSFAGVLPGEYFVVAIDALDVPEIADPAFFEIVSKFATRVSVGVDEKKTQDLIVRRIK